MPSNNNYNNNDDEPIILKFPSEARRLEKQFNNWQLIVKALAVGTLIVGSLRHCMEIARESREVLERSRQNQPQEKDRGR